MGDRANVVFTEKVKRTVTGIFLYSHWGGTDLPATLQDALKRSKGRWDALYLPRIVLNEMTKDEPMSLTGYGISTTLCDNEHPLIIVDLDTSTVGLSKEDPNFDSEINTPALLLKRRQGNLTFEEYVNLDFSDEDNSPSFWDVLCKACQYKDQ